jgi:hypothetical protein
MANNHIEVISVVASSLEEACARFNELNKVFLTMIVEDGIYKFVVKGYSDNNQTNAEDFIPFTQDLIAQKEAKVKMVQLLIGAFNEGLMKGRFAPKYNITKHAVATNTSPGVRSHALYKEISTIAKKLSRANIFISLDEFKELAQKEGYDVRFLNDGQTIFRTNGNDYVAYEFYPLKNDKQSKTE